MVEGIGGSIHDSGELLDPLKGDTDVEKWFQDEVAGERTTAEEYLGSQTAYCC